MNNKQIKGLAVMSIADGERLGTVDRVYVDFATKRVIGFTVASAGGLLAPGTPLPLDAAAVQSIGPDALMVKSRAAVTGKAVTARVGSLVDIDDVLKRQVVTTGGTAVGAVAGVAIDEQTCRLSAVEVSPGFFKTNQVVPIAEVVHIGPDVVVVTEAVCAAPDPTPLPERASAAPAS